MTNKERFLKAHSITRETLARFGGDYRATFAVALSQVWKVKEAEVSMKRIPLKGSDYLEQDEQGKWKLHMPAIDIHESVFQKEAIDIVARRLGKAEVRKHFPMHGFHS